MPLFLIGCVVYFVILLGCAFIVGNIEPIMSRSKVFRFVFFFLLCIPLNLIINYVRIWAFGSHKMSLGGASIYALFFAIFGTFLPPSPATKAQTPIGKEQSINGCSTQ